MKRKILMMGLAMMSGLPHAVYARSGSEGASHPYSFWNSSYMPHYGAKGMAEPLLDHVSVAGVSAPGAQGISNAWRLEFTPPQPVSNADNPIADQGIRAGFSLTLNF